MLNILEIFQKGRTCNEFSSKDIDEDILIDIYDLMKLGPTSANSSPLRILFIKKGDNKDKLMDCIMPGNIEKTSSAPIVAIFAWDEKFFEKMDFLFPVSSALADFFRSNEEASQDSAFRNSTLQAAYFMIIARSYGLDCGPMSGFDNKKLDEMFFSGTNYKSNFICNLGYKADSEPKYDRLPKLSFEDVCKII